VNGFTRINPQSHYTEVIITLVEARRPEAPAETFR